MKSIFGVLLVLAVGFATYRIIVERSSLSTHMSLKLARTNEKLTKGSLLLVAALLLLFCYFVTESLLGIFVATALISIGYLVYNFVRERQTLGIIHPKKDNKKYLILPLAVLLISFGGTGVMAAQGKNSSHQEQNVETKTSSKEDKTDKDSKEEKSEKKSVVKKSSKSKEKSKSKENSESNKEDVKDSEKSDSDAKDNRHDDSDDRGSKKHSSSSKNDSKPSRHKPSKPGKHEKPGKEDKPSKKPSKPDKEDKPSKKPSKPDKEDKPSKPDKEDKPSKPDKEDKPAEKPAEKPEEKPSEPEKPAEKPEEKPGESEKPEGGTEGTDTGNQDNTVPPIGGSINGH